MPARIERQSAGCPAIDAQPQRAVPTFDDPGAGKAEQANECGMAQLHETTSLSQTPGRRHSSNDILVADAACGGAILAARHWEEQGGIAVEELELTVFGFTHPRRAATVPSRRGSRRRRRGPR